jgi:hypothetical protein
MRLRVLRKLDTDGADFFNRRTCLPRQGSINCLLPCHPLPQPDLQRFRQFADQQCVAPGDPAVDGPGRAGLQGFVEQGLGGDVVVDQAEFVLQLG